MSLEAPLGWRSGAFNDFMTLQRGFDLPVQDRRDGDVPVFASNGQIATHSVARVSGPSVVTGRSGTLGKVLFSPEASWPLNTTLYVKDFHENDPKFVYWFLQFFRLERFGTGTGVPTLNRNVVHNEAVVFPPLVEQRCIAEILSSVDEAIHATQAVIDQTRKAKRAALQAALKQPIGLDETQVWPTHTLDELTPKNRKVTYGIVQAGPHVPNGVPYVRVSDMAERSLSPNSMLRTSPEIAARFARSTILPGDIVFALRGKIGHVLITPSSLSGANLTQGTARIAPGERVSADFLLWALRSPTVESQIKSAVKGSTFKEITLGDLKAIQIPVPPNAIQEAIVQCLNGMEDAMWTAHDHRQALVRLKASLTSDLLTGRKRVTSDLP